MRSRRRRRLSWGQSGRRQLKDAALDDVERRIGDAAGRLGRRRRSGRRRGRRLFVFDVGVALLGDLREGGLFQRRRRTLLDAGR